MPAPQVPNIASNSWDDRDFQSEKFLSVTSACLEMGSCLGISSETCKRVEQRVLENPHSTPITPITPIGAEVGFSHQDVTSYLGSTLPGAKFLALVCPLVTAFDPVECAEVLAGVMECYPKVKEGRHPGAGAIVPLVSAIDARCELSGFAEHVVDYEILFTRRFRDKVKPRPCKTPSPKAILRLIYLLQMGDLLNTKLKSVNICAGVCLPWIAAFIHWWLDIKLEMEPLDDYDESFGAFKTEKGVHITLGALLNESEFDQIEITAFRYSPLARNRQSFESGRLESYGGLVAIKSYFSLMLNAFQLDQGDAAEETEEVIPYALNDAYIRLRLCSERCISPRKLCDLATRIAHSKRPGGDLRVVSSRFEPFPERSTVKKILHLVKGCEGESMHDWKSGSRSRPAPPPTLEPRTIFAEQIAQIVATILALSLFYNPEELLIRPDPFVWRTFQTRPSTIISAIKKAFTGEDASCDVMEWHRICRKLAGDRGGEAQEGEQQKQWETIIACFAGQVVWPAITFGLEIPKHESYLRLHWRRGHVRLKSFPQVYSRVIGVNSRIDPGDVSQGEPELPLGPVEFKMEDEKSSGARGRVLLCSMVRQSVHGSGTVEANPCDVFKSLSSAEQLRWCPHADIDTDTDANIGTEDESDVVSSGIRTPDELPHGLDEIGETKLGTVAIVPAVDNDRLRFFALATSTGAHVAVGYEACDKCCIKFCTKFGINVLVTSKEGVEEDED
ncbi:hypothetical protein F4821DRAFT_280375 [Hypoxylon rubiginosum]|uniref:Uncharacterized protein n=1 Tax=Hypoxylon rubiginosum TaxID=110542 RepID=A0ACC0CUU2_9PEZI|nr:hypothetical protein F4821DRAFT_280375 [Hypoxylon rubiginosum]